MVRRARPKETFVTLDGKNHQLQQDMLLICDASRGVALAGIMGGLNSEISPQTNTVLIESAYFQPTGTRRTAKTLGLNTESCYRFERGVDPEGVITALDRAAQLMVELGDGVLAVGLGGLTSIRLPSAWNLYNFEFPKPIASLVWI